MEALKYEELYRSNDSGSSGAKKANKANLDIKKLRKRLQSAMNKYAEIQRQQKPRHELSPASEARSPVDSRYSLNTDEEGKVGSLGRHSSRCQRSQ